MKKRLLSTMLALCMMLTILPMNALATEGLPEAEIPIEGEVPEPAPLADSPSSGTCGENLTWKLDNGTLTISGTGTMTNFNGSSQPWIQAIHSITTVIIEDNVTSIGSYAFFGCDRLADVTIPDSVTSIDGSAFKNCSSLTSITIPDGVTSIKDYTFSGCGSLISAVIPDSVTSIGNYAFWNCSNLANVTMPNSVTRIGADAFFGCSSLTSVILSNNIAYISGYTFSGCSSLTSITIPDGVIDINSDAFFGCNSLISIIMPDSVTSIGDRAFMNCSSLTDIYFSGDESAWNAITVGYINENLTNATIHYNSTGPDDEGGDKPVKPPVKPPTDPSETEYKVYYPGGSETFYVSLEDCAKRTSSDKYNPHLAYMLISMCNSVHSKTDMDATFESFKFDKKLRAELAFITFSIGTKQLADGNTLVSVIVRGTGNLDDDLNGWLSNIFDAGANSKGEHSGFSDAAKEIYNTMVDFLGTENFSKMKFVITGHSRGAAAANILAKNLVDLNNGSTENIYAYTFACPDVAVITEQKANSYKNIFNIGNAKDVVTWVPRAIWMKSGEADGWGRDSYWDKYGQSYWYCDNWGNKVSLDLAHCFDEHVQDKYLKDIYGKTLNDYRKRTETMHVTDLSLLNWVGFGIYKFKLTRLLFFCPVDVKIYTSDNQFVGEIINNEINISMTDKMYAYTINDEKYVYLADDNYIIKLSGTDDGTMEYAVQSIDLETGGGIIEEKTFKNVSLFNGKQMISYANVDNVEGTDTSIVPLYILDEDGNRIKEVLPDENSTEIYISRTITFDANGGAVNPTTLATGTDGKLPSLPTPTRNDYQFKGWFTAATDGTQITADTIFTSDTTIHAQWGNSNGNGGNGSGENNGGNSSNGGSGNGGNSSGDSSNPNGSDNNGGNSNTNSGSNTTNNDKTQGGSTNTNTSQNSSDASGTTAGSVSSDKTSSKSPSTGDASSIIWLCFLGILAISASIYTAVKKSVYYTDNSRRTLK